MAKAITKQQLLDLVKDKSFKTEDEFRDYLKPLLVKLFKVKENQVETESVTTSFDYTLSNRADIIIKTDGDFFKKAFIVFELKLSKSLEQFKNGDYTEADKQLKKYCQDVRAPYGVLLTEDFCAIYRNKYYSYDQEPKRDKENKLPSISQIEDILVKEALLNLRTHNKSFKYILLIILFVLLLLIAIGTVKEIFGLNHISTSILSFISGIVIGLISEIIFWVRKTFY